MRSLAMFQAIAIALLIAPFSHAALFTDKAINEFADKKLEPVIEQSNQNKQALDEHDKRLKELSETVKLQAETINKVIKQLEEVQSKLDINAEKIDSISVEPPTPFWIKVLLGIIVALILAVLGFFFWPRKLGSSVPADATSRMRCPRCGWEHDPGDTVCKNPLCKTQF